MTVPFSMAETTSSFFVSMVFDCANVLLNVLDVEMLCVDMLRVV